MAKKTRTRGDQQRKPASPERPPASLQVWQSLADSAGFRWLMFGVVIALILIARFVHIGADPAMDVSWSHDLFTDPPQYTSYARNAVVFGEWNPIGDDRLIFFQKNITGVVSYFVFTVLGPSVASGQLVAILLNLIAVGCIMLIAYRSYGIYAGITAGLFLSINYLFVNYSRMPFLEVASNGALAAALLLLLRSRNTWWWAIIGGVIAGAGTFFGKITALHAAPIFLLVAALIGWQSVSESRIKRWGRPLGYGIGMAAIYVVWYIYAYMQASDQVLAYLKEQSLSLYGTPVGLTSIQGFINQWFSFSVNNELLLWSPILAILGVLGMAGLIMRAIPSVSIRDMLTRMDPVALAIVGWFWSAWAAFMPFNYRPVRYQIVLLLPLAAAAGWLVSRALSSPQGRSRREKPAPTSWWAVVPVAVVFATTLQLMVMPLLMNMRANGAFMRGITFSVILGVALALLSVYMIRPRTAAPATSPGIRVFGSWLVVAAVLVFVVNQGRHFVRWWAAPQHSLEQANADIEAVLGTDAILTGGYGTPLAQGGYVGSFPAMFGVSEVDTDFFKTFPVTHVAEVDDENQPFVKNYPDIARNAQRITTYTIRNLPVSVVRVAELGGSLDASKYTLSPYEMFRQRVQGDTLNTLLTFLPEWIADSGNHFSGWRWLGDSYMRANRLDEALDAYDHAVSFFPDDFFLWAQIGDVSWEYYRTGGTSEYGDRAIEAWSRALELNPANPQLLARLSRANGP